MTVDEIDVEAFRRLEQDLHRSEIRTSRDAVNALLVDEFVEFGSSGGIYNKAAVVDALAQEPPRDPDTLPEIHDFTVRPIAAEAVLVLYRSVRRSDKGVPERQTLRSSIWKLVDGRWRMFFHQGTIVPGH